MKKVTSNKRAFTLIELLVVVLIIGILAAVAMPQYQKAVRKARLAEVATTFNSISKAIDLWLLQNGGYPSSSVTFSGNGSNSVKLDITQSCVEENSTQCFTKLGLWAYNCDSTACRITFNFAEGAANTWLSDFGWFNWSKFPGGEWGLDNASYFPTDLKPELCRWWKEMYGDGRVINYNNGNVANMCDAY